MNALLDCPTLAPTLKLTMPLAVPLPDVTVSQLGSLLAATQLQPGWVVKPKLPVPPPAAKFCDVELKKKEQPEA